MAIIPTTKTTIARYAAGLYGVKLGGETLAAVVEDVQFNTANGVSGLNTVLNSYYAPFAGMTSAQVAAIVVANAGVVEGRYGLTAANVADAMTVVTAELNSAAPIGNQGAAIANVLAAWSNTFTEDAVFGPAARAWNLKIAQANAYASGANSPDVAFGEVNTEFVLAPGSDRVTGTDGDDTFVAGLNALNDGDVINGGGGFDTLKAMVNGVIAPTIKDVEHLQFQAQFRTGDSGDNNLASDQVVKVDFNTNVTSVTGFNAIENSNSRADLIIEDVRIANNQVTKDITIVMRETDPGNVDYGVYFDQNSLRSVSSSKSQINLRVLDTYNTSLGNAPLKDSPYGSFKFSYSLDGAAPVSVTLASQEIQDAQTFPELVAAMQAAADAEFGVGTVTVSLGGKYSVPDSVTAKLVEGTEVVLSAKGNVTFSTPAGSGWLATDVVPAISGLHTSFNVGGATTTELVTSNIILDDVGRGSTGGDLVVGGLSVGETSTSKGVEKFLIEVQDNSKLQTINSTNNTLKEVVITSGITTRVNNAYNENEKDAGSLTVRGIEQPNDGFGNAALPGSNNTVAGVVYNQHNAFGFSDVRLLDASAFKGKLDIDAEITRAAIPKYLSLKDVQALPAGDNIAVTYLGGSNNDKIALQLDAGIASSRSTIAAGREDFTFHIDGGAGNDEITLNVVDTLAGGAQAWYNNQKLNANITIDGGEGNDTIRTPGAGDVKINAGAGDDTIYTDNTGALLVNANATGSAGTAATAYANAAAAELAAAQAARVLSNAIGPVATDGTAAGTAVSAAAVVAGLQAIDVLTPTNAPALPAITHAALAAATAAQAAAGTITLAQKIALDAAYNSATGGVITPAVGIGAPATLVGHAPVAGNVNAAELAAGDALLATYMAAANAAVAADAAAAANVVVQNGLLNGTQQAVVNAYMAINAVEDLVAPGVQIGTGTTVAAMTALQTALVNGATQAQVVAAIDAATAKGLFVNPLITTTPAAVLAAAGAGAMDAADAAAVVALLSPIANSAALANAAAQAAYATAVANDTAAVNAAATSAAGNSVNGNGVVIGAVDSIGSAEAANAAAVAAIALGLANADVAASQAINTALSDLKAAVNVGTLDAGVTIALQNANAAINAAIASSTATGTGAVTVNPLTVPVVTALLGLAGVPSAAVDAAEELAFETGALGIANVNSVNSLIIANTVQTDLLTAVAADRAATATATATASTIATAAANSGGQSDTFTAPKAVFVFNTSDQSATYNSVTADDRNLADLKSDANNSHNFFNSTVSVTYKGLEAKVIVAGTGYKTSDLELNQAIKKAINGDAVLSKLLVATDGPANTLVVTSLIDGVHTTADLAVTVTLPAIAGLTTADASGAAAAYGMPAASTVADVLAAMGVAKTGFDTKGDYTTQFAESGAAGGNVNLVGANSVTSSDNTVTGGSGNDVIVLGTTVGTDALTSSNEKLVFAAGFGNDTIVNFAATGLGIDTLDFTALKGSGAAAFGSLSADKSIVVGAQTAANDTAAEIAALFTDSATAINHVYVAYDAHNVGHVYMVSDAAGVAAGNVTATMVGTIDLADTSWATLTAANFA